MYNKKGQAAMEFLMTYGWAILAAVIVVGVLWYMIGNPANLAGNNFQISAPFVANAMAVDSNGDVTIEIRNGEAVSVTVTNVTVSGDSGCVANDTSTLVTAGSLLIRTLNCSVGSGDRLNGDVVVKYQKTGSTIVQSATGSVSGKAP